MYNAYARICAQTSDFSRFLAPLIGHRAAEIACNQSLSLSLSLSFIHAEKFIAEIQEAPIGMRSRIIGKAERCLDSVNER
jgi:hypothetical protein